MIIKITNGEKTKEITIRKLFSFSSEKKINESGILKISFATDIEGIQSFHIKKGYLIQAYLPQDNFHVSCIFSGFVSDIEIRNDVINIFAYDFIGYTKYRILKEEKTYTQTPIYTIISDIYSTLNTDHPLPFVLGKNNCNEEISITIKANMSLYFILKELVKKVERLEFRQSNIITKDGTNNILDVDIQTGKTLPGIRQDNAKIRQRKSEVIGWSYKDSFGNFCNYWYDDKNNIVQNEDNIKDTLLFEKYETNPETTPNALHMYDKGLPHILLDTAKEDIGKISVGDRKLIKLISHVEWISFDYMGIIQEVKLSSTNTGGYMFSVKIGDKIIEQKNILDQTLENIGKKLSKIN